MSEASEACRTLAAALAGAALLTPPDPLPCSPLDLLVALHAEVTSVMLSDLARASRAATAARQVAARFPDAPLLQALAHWSQGSAVLYVPDYGGALAHYDAALKWYERACAASAPHPPARDVRVVHVVRVFCLFELGRYSEALAAVELAERWLAAHHNDYARLTLLLNRSFLAGSLGDHSQMLALSDEMIALACQLGHPSRLAQGWLNRGYACIALGRFAEAAAAIDQGVTIAQGEGETITVARGLYNRARLLRSQGQLFAALTSLEAARAGFAQATGEAASIALEEASLYEQLRQLPEALNAARFAAEQFALQQMPAYSASAALQASRVAMFQGQITQARQLLTLATEQAGRARLPTLQAMIVLAEADLAALRGSRRQRLRARRLAHQAVALLSQSGLVHEVLTGRLTVAALDALLDVTAAAQAAYSDLAERGPPWVQLAAHAALGALLPSSEALPHLRRAAGIAVEQRRALPIEELQARYSSETSLHHLNLTSCYLALGRTTEAIERIWEAKAGSLLDLRAAAGSLDSATHTVLEAKKVAITTWRAEELSLSRETLAASQQGQHERAAHLSGRAKVASAQRQASELALTAALRIFGDRNGQAPVPSMAALQATFTPKMALLEYAQLGDALVVAVVRHHTPPVLHRLGDYAALAPLLDRWSIVCHRLMGREPTPDGHQQVQAVLRPLWDRVIAPVAGALEGVEHLLIAPYGVLHHIPWAALFDGECYLSDRVALSLTPSGALWAAPSASPAVAPGPPLLLGYAGAGTRQLRYVEAELTALGQLFPEARLCSAARAADLRATPPPRLLHIAAHGQTNSTAPLCSTLELADGPFLLLEAHRLDLRGTALVTLSACETSVRPDYGDMALALAGAFLCAGASAVVASLWAVDDAATATLMTELYAGLAAGRSPTIALRAAQQVVRAAYPLDWAAFQLWVGARI